MMPVDVDYVPRGLPTRVILADALRTVRRIMGMEVAFVSEFTDGERVFREVDSDPDFTPICVGDGTTRHLDDASNTYIGLHVRDPTLGAYKYAEYQYVCSPEQIAAKNCFSKIDMFQLFDLTKDPYELHNVYNETAPEIRDALEKKLRTWYPCKGPACP